MTASESPATALDDRQAAFCREYIYDFNASRAAREAGYAPGTVRGHAHALLQNVAIRQEIDRLIRERAERTLVTADRVVLELAAVAFSTHDDYVVTADGELELADGVDPLASRAVASVRKRVKNRRRGDAQADGIDTEFKLWNKLDALRLLMKHLGMLDRRVTVVGDPAKPVAVDVRTTSLSLTAADIVAARSLVAEADGRMPEQEAILNCLRDLGLPYPDDPPTAPERPSPPATPARPGPPAVPTPGTPPARRA